MSSAAAAAAKAALARIEQATDVNAAPVANVSTTAPTTGVMREPRPFQGFLLVREPLTERHYVDAVTHVAAALGAENIRFRITFASTVLVEERRQQCGTSCGAAAAENHDGVWVPYAPVHGRGAMSASAARDLGTIALPCALLAPARDAVPWLAAKPLPQCAQPLFDGEALMVDELLRRLYDDYVPVFVLRSTFAQDVQTSTRLRANGIFVVVPPPPPSPSPSACGAQPDAVAATTTTQDVALDKVDQSGVAAFAGPCAVRLCYIGAPSAPTASVAPTDALPSPSSLAINERHPRGRRLLLMKPTTAHAIRCWLGGGDAEAAAAITRQNQLEQMYGTDVTRALRRVLNERRAVPAMLFDQDAPLFFVRSTPTAITATATTTTTTITQPTNVQATIDSVNGTAAAAAAPSFALVKPADVVALAPLVADGHCAQQALLDVIDQAESALDAAAHEAFVTRLGDAIERVTRGERGDGVDAIAAMREQLLAEAGGDESDERRIVAQMAARLRAYGQQRRDERKRREKALEGVRKRLAKSICSTGLTTVEGNLKVALRAKKIQQNVERAATISADALGTLLEEACDEYGVLFVQLEPAHFVAALRARDLIGPLFDAMDRLLGASARDASSGDGSGGGSGDNVAAALPPVPFDALTAGAIIEYASARPHPLQQAVVPDGPTMLTPSPAGTRVGGVGGVGAGAHSFFAVPLLDVVVAAHDLGTAFNWVEQANRECVAIPRILQVEALVKSRVARDAGVHALATEDAVRRFVAVLCLRAAQHLADRLSTLDGGFRGTDEAHFDDTTRAMLRGLVGWAVLTLAAGANPQSMVFEVLCSTIGRPERPRSAADWALYAAVVRLLPATGWETRTTQTACARILARCLNSAVHRFTQAVDATSVDDKKRYFAALCYQEWVRGGLPHTAKRSKFYRLEHGKYDRSMPPPSVAAAFVEQHPEYTAALGGGVATWAEFKERVQTHHAHSQATAAAAAAAAAVPSATRADNDDDALVAPARSGNAVVQAALLAASVTESELRDMCAASNNLVRLAEASTADALASVAALCRADDVAHMMTLARCAGFGADDDAIRRTFGYLTEFFYARRHCQQVVASVEEEALVAVLDWMQGERRQQQG